MNDDLGAPTPADCSHRTLIAGTTVQRCARCGQALPLYESPAEAIRAMRARLRPDPEEAP